VLNRYFAEAPIGWMVKDRIKSLSPESANVVAPSVATKRIKKSKSIELT
jgi:hypothetical protein